MQCLPDTADVGLTTVNFSPADWRNTDTVLLDMDGTLLDLHFDNQFWMELIPQRWGEARGLDAEAAKLALYPRFVEHQGSLNWYCLDFWTDELELPVAALKRELMHLIGFLPGAEAFLQSARADGKQLVLMTNAHRDSLNLKIEVTGLDQYFDRVLTSHDYGLAKEQDGFWEILEQDVGFEPPRSLMVDDSQNVLAAAAKHGIRVVQSLAPDTKKPANVAGRFSGVHRLGEMIP